MADDEGPSCRNCDKPLDRGDYCGRICEDMDRHSCTTTNERIAMNLKDMHKLGYITDRAVVLVSLVRCGFTNAEAEEIIDKASEATARPARQPWTRWSDEQKDALLNMYAEGRSLKEMATTLDRSIRQVQSALLRFKVREDD